MAAVQVAPLHVVARKDAPINTIDDLRGQRVRISGAELLTRGPHAGDLVEATLTEFGVAPKSMTLKSLSAVDALAALAPGELDAAVTFVVMYPSPHVQLAMKEGARLIPIEGPNVERLRHRYPFLRFSRIPPGTYPGQTDAVHTIGVDVLLVCRSDMEARLVYRLTKAFFAAAERLSSASASMRLADLSEAAEAPIPLHEGAALYYRERELLP
jgi:TRAP transporter TAXI family solute receptor